MHAYPLLQTETPLLTFPAQPLQLSTIGDLFGLAGHCPFQHSFLSDPLPLTCYAGFPPLLSRGKPLYIFISRDQIKTYLGLRVNNTATAVCTPSYSSDFCAIPHGPRRILPFSIELILFYLVLCYGATPPPVDPLL